MLCHVNMYKVKWQDLWAMFVSVTTPYCWPWCAPSHIFTSHPFITFKIQLHTSVEWPYCVWLVITGTCTFLAHLYLSSDKVKFESKDTLILYLDSSKTSLPESKLICYSEIGNTLFFNEVSLDTCWKPQTSTLTEAKRILPVPLIHVTVFSMWCNGEISPPVITSQR